MAEEDFWPVFGRTEDDIWANMVTRANEGLTPSDDEWVDTSEGSYFWINNRPCMIEVARVYDRLNEAVAASFVSTAWDEFLDNHVESYGQARTPAAQATGVQTFVGPPGTLVGTGVQVQPPQTDPDVEPPIFETTGSGTIGGGGTLDLPIRALKAGQEGNVAALAISQLGSGLGANITSVSNAAATSGGGDVESDTSLRSRMIRIFRGNVWGTRPWYENIVLAVPGVGQVTVIPHRDGAGTVAIIAQDDVGNPLSNPMIALILAMLDPVPGMGEGLAPAEHYVSVETAVRKEVYVKATGIEYDTGYSLDGTPGSIALRAQIVQRITDYVSGLKPGAEVNYNQVRSQILRVTGVHDVATLGIGVALNPAGVADIPTTSLQVARLHAGDGIAFA